MQNMKVHEDRRKLFSATAGKEPANPFIRQRPLVSKGNSSDSAAPPAPWATDSSSSAPLFPRSTLTNRFIHYLMFLWFNSALSVCIIFRSFTIGYCMANRAILMYYYSLDLHILVHAGWFLPLNDAIFVPSSVKWILHFLYCILLQNMMIVLQIKPYYHILNIWQTRGTMCSSKKRKCETNLHQLATWHVLICRAAVWDFS